FRPKRKGGCRRARDARASSGGSVMFGRPQGGPMREQLIRIDDIPPTGTVTVDLLGREVLVMLLNGKPRAYVNVCMHHGGPLTLEGDTFTCDWHGSTFEARSGRALSGPVR